MPQPPEWAVKPFVSLYEDALRDALYLNLQIYTLQCVRMFSTEVLERAKAEPMDEEKRARFLERTERLIEMAEDETRREYSTVYHLPVIALWELLAAAVDDFVIASFVNDPTSLTLPEISKKLAAPRFQNLTVEDR